MLQIILCLMVQASQPESTVTPTPTTVLVSEMDYRGNKLVYAKNSNAVTIFSQHVLFYAIDNPEFAQYLVNAGITTFVMADGSTINIETLKRDLGFGVINVVAIILCCAVIIFYFILTIKNNIELRSLRELVANKILKEED